MPAAIIRRAGQPPSANCDRFSFDVCPLLFGLCSLPAFMASHQSVITITASGMPSRNPRCGTSKLVTALPQRQPFSTSGRIVYEWAMCRRMSKIPPPLRLMSLKIISQPKPPFRITSSGVRIPAIRLRVSCWPKRCRTPTSATPIIQFSMNSELRRLTPSRR